jgi:MOSC domain-containing protein YiiM
MVIGGVAHARSLPYHFAVDTVGGPGMGTVTAIFIAPSAEAPMEELAAADLEAGRGIVGDRYHTGVGTWSKPGQEHLNRRHVTLIESEAVDAVARDYHIPFGAKDSRRNIVTRGVALNHLVGAEFSVGSVRLRGIKLCEPCSHMEGLAGQPVRKPLVHRGGLNCEVLKTGTIRVGDSVEVVGGPPGR